MEFFLIIFIIFPLSISQNKIDIWLSEYSKKYIYNITTDNHYIISDPIDNRNIELRFFFSKKNYTSNPNPFTIVYEEYNSDYIDKGIVDTYKDSTKDYYVVYARHYCHSYKYKKDRSDVTFEVIPTKNISSCIVTVSAVNDTSLAGKILFFGLFVFCILISIITILKTKACGDCEKKSENVGPLQNDPFQFEPQPQTNERDEQPLIQP